MSDLQDAFTGQSAHDTSNVTNYDAMDMSISTLDMEYDQELTSTVHLNNRY